MPHFCARCGDPYHRETHCPETISAENKCRYPLCSTTSQHTTKVCSTLHTKCSTCSRRGHRHNHHNLFTPVQLDSIFCWWSPQGAYTSLIFLEESKARKSQVQDWHWSAYLHAVPRNACQMLMASIGYPFVLLPNPPKLPADRNLNSTPLWMFPPFIQKKVVEVRQQMEAQKLEAERKKQEDQQTHETSQMDVVSQQGLDPADHEMEIDQNPSSVCSSAPGTSTAENPNVATQGQDRFIRIEENFKIIEACISNVGLPTSPSVIAMQTIMASVKSIVTETKMLHASHRALRLEVEQLKKQRRLNFSDSTAAMGPDSPLDIEEELTGLCSRSRTLKYPPGYGPSDNNRGGNKRARSQTPSNQRGGNPKRGRNDRSRSRSRSRNRQGNNSNNWQSNNSNNSNNAKRGRGNNNKRGRGRGGNRGYFGGNRNQNRQNDEPKENTGANVFFYQSEN